VCLILFYLGKIDKSDWNVKEIERKIEENKMHAKHVKNGTEKVPKWSRPQFDDKVNIIKCCIIIFLLTLYLKLLLG